MTTSNSKNSLRVLAGAVLIALLGGCAQPWPQVQAPRWGGPPQPRSIASRPAREAATTAHPLATQAALAMLERGGAPIDAAIAAQMVLGLVEPQSSGLGGGSLLLVWDQRSQLLASYDGLATAPARVTPGLNIDVDGSAIARGTVDRGGRSVGVPGTLAVLAQAHRRHGRLPWTALFAPAIELAERGFPLPSYLHGILAAPTAAADHPDLLPLFFGADGKVLPVGTTVVNPAYAKTLRHIAEVGTPGLWEDEYGAAIVATARRGLRPTLMTQDDLASYRSRERDPLCGPFLAYTVCMMAPPSFGGVVVLQTLRMLEARPTVPGLPRFDFDNPYFVHWFAEAGRLAQADRQQYVGDPDFVAVPTDALVAQRYLAQRAAQIDPLRAAAQVEAGSVEEKKSRLAPVALGVPPSEPADATSQLAIVDSQGNALSMTTTINLNFGSRLMANGFVLNNALTNFSAPPEPGQRAPNRMEAGKRPVTSMAPTIVFDRASGLPVVVGGSAGGGQIVDYISQSLVEMLANGRTPGEALARGHVSTAVRGKLQLEAGTAAADLAPALRAQGHDVAVVPMTSGLGFLLQSGDGWIGAADPRRDGLALGQ